MRLQEIVEDDRHEAADFSENWIVRNKRGSLSLERDGGLKCFRRAKAVGSAKPGGNVGNLKVD